jgi:hypothetical protein
LLTAGQRSKPQYSRFFPKLSEALLNTPLIDKCQALFDNERRQIGNGAKFSLF